MDLGPETHLLGDIPDRSPACEVLIARIATDIEAHTDAIAERLVDRIAAEMDLVRENEDVRDDLLAVARACASLLTSMTRAWSDPRAVPPPEDALQWSRSLVSRRLGMDSVLRVFRLGQSGYREVWHRQLAASGEEPSLILEALLATEAFAFMWVDAILMPLARAYEEERERTMRGAQAVRAETVDAILAGTAPDPPLVSARLGYDLDREHLAFVTWADRDDGEGARDRIEDVSTELARIMAPGRRPLLMRVTPRVVHGWVPHGSLDAAQMDEVRALLTGAGVHLAVGRSRRGVDGFRTSHQEACRARRVARLLNRAATATRYEDVAVADLLTHEPDVAREVVRDALGPLAIDDDATRRLIATLRVFLQEGQSYSKAARRLGIHENTVAYRVRRVLDLTGQQDAGSLVLRTAVELVPLLHGEPGDEP